MDDEEERECMNKTLSLLNDTKKKFHEIWEEYGFDLAMFNVNVDLKIIVDDVEVRVKEKWEKMK